MAMTPEQFAALPTIKLVYLGAIALVGNKLGGAFLDPELLGDGYADPTRHPQVKLFDRKNMRGVVNTVGGIYEFKTEDPAGNSIYTKTGKFLHVYPDRENVVVWAGTSRAREREFEAKKRAKKESSLNLYQAQLEPLRRLVQTTSGPQRALIIADIVYHLTK